MVLQTRNLVMVGLGVKDDEPPNSIQPRLADGIHMRWAFKRECGFPWYGYYLFRRVHRPGNPLCLSQAIPPLGVGKWHSNILSTPRGVISSENHLRLTDDFQPYGKVEFDLSESRRFYYRVPTHDHPARRIELKIGFRDTARIEITGLFGEGAPYHPCIQQRVRGTAGDVVAVTLEFDAISSVHIDSGPIALIDVCYVPVSQEAYKGWEVVPDFTYPLRLPVTHPDYPCTAMQKENLPAERAIARRRVFYDDPDKFTAPPLIPIYKTGTVSVIKDSPIVSGAGTKWNDNLVGAVLQVSGDHTAYVIVKIVSINRLILSRAYGGASQAGVNYEICDDAFGQLHDQLAMLVSGGPNPPTTPMADRSLPGVIYSTGTVMVEGGQTKVIGKGTNWTNELTGLGFQVLGDNTGTVSVSHGADIVSGYATKWIGDMEGMTFRITGELVDYTIVKIISATALKLDRGYESLKVSGKIYTTSQKAVYTIAHVDSPSQLKLHRPYVGPKKAKKTDYQIVATLQSGISNSNAPRMSKQYPLDLVLLGTLHPALAQIAGLYWVDQQAEPGVAYDYLIMDGCPDLLTARNDPNPEKVLWVAQTYIESGFMDVDGYIVFNKKVEKAVPLPSPKNLRAYALPGSYIPQPKGPSIDAQNNAGLKWDLGVKDGVLLPRKAIMYHLWRTNKSNDEPAAHPVANQYSLLTYDEKLKPKREKPILVPRMSEQGNPHPPIWPPFRMHAIDRALKDGWYCYAISGIDIFGRHSPHSDPAQWYQWTPETDSTPWYYKQRARDSRARDSLVHSFSIQLLDKIPPTPPAGIEVHTLDPMDPMVFQDYAYDAWRTQHPGKLGVRISWLWTPAHSHQAPDIREFRIYFQPGRTNALLGNTLSVKSISETESKVETDIPNKQSAGKYIGATLRIGSASFKVVDNEAGSPLKLRVKSGPFYNKGKTEVQDGSVIVKGNNTSWKKHLIGCTLRVANEQTTYTILDVREKPLPQQLKLDHPYHGKLGNTPQTYTITGKSPVAKKPCTIVIPSEFRAGTVKFAKGSENIAIGKDTAWTDELIGRTLQIVGESPKYTIVKVDSPEQLKISTKYQGHIGEHKAYVITHPLFTDYGTPISWEQRIQVVGYDEHVTETIRPVQSADGKYLTGTEAIVTGKVVQLDTQPESKPDLSSIPIKEETLFPAYLLLDKDTKRPSKIYRITGVNHIKKSIRVDGQPDTGGVVSTWSIGLPVRKYEMFLTLPTEKFNPTLANPIVYAQIGVSAADDKTHTLDHAKWGGDRDRYGNEGRVGAPVKISRVWRQKPKAPVPPPDSEKVFATPANYHGHSFYTYRWEPQKHLKTHIFRALDDTLFKVDWAKRSENKMLSLDPNNPKHLKKFPPPPPDWNANKHQPVATELNSFVVTGAAANVADDVVTLDGAPDLTKVKAGRDFVWLK